MGSQEIILGNIKIKNDCHLKIPKNSELRFPKNAMNGSLYIKGKFPRMHLLS